MSREKGGPTHSQTLGIIWLSAGLLIIGGIVFFSSRQSAEGASEDPTSRQNTEILSSHEDSAYRSRNKKPYNRQYHSKKTETKKEFDSSWFRHETPTPTRQPLKVELNSADTLTLQLLHGIGPAYARRIVAYRDRLGGFHDTKQLLEVYGFTPEFLAHITPSLTLDTADLRRIDINRVELKQLIRHPYIEYYQARDIVRLRNSGTRFLSADDLRAVPSMNDSTLQRILPYLTFDDSTTTKHSHSNTI